jgi:hypothetical protein
MPEEMLSASEIETCDFGEAFFGVFFLGAVLGATLGAPLAEALTGDDLATALALAFGADEDMTCKSKLKFSMKFRATFKEVK